MSLQIRAFILVLAVAPCGTNHTIAAYWVRSARNVALQLSQWDWVSTTFLTQTAALATR